MANQLIIIDGDMQSALRDVRFAKTEFEAAKSQSEGLAGAVGHASLAKACRDFESSWWVHRARSLRALEAVEQNIVKSIEVFEEVDEPPCLPDPHPGIVPQQPASPTSPATPPTLPGSGGTTPPPLTGPANLPSVPPPSLEETPSSLDTEPTESEIRAELEEEQRSDAYQALVRRWENMVAGWESMTPAQQAAVMTAIGTTGAALLISLGKLPATALVPNPSTTDPVPTGASEESSTSGPEPVTPGTDPAQTGTREIPRFVAPLPGEGPMVPDLTAETTVEESPDSAAGDSAEPTEEPPTEPDLPPLPPLEELLGEEPASTGGGGGGGSGGGDLPAAPALPPLPDLAAVLGEGSGTATGPFPSGTQSGGTLPDLAQVLEPAAPLAADASAEDAENSPRAMAPMMGAMAAMGTQAASTGASIATGSGKSGAADRLKEAEEALEDLRKERAKDKA